MSYSSHRVRKSLALVGTLGLLTTFLAFAPQASLAAPGDPGEPLPFSADTAQQLYIAQGVPCDGASAASTGCEQLFIATRTVDPDDLDSPIKVEFDPAGPVYQGGNYNAAAYRVADNYLYAIDNHDNLLRIGSYAPDPTSLDAKGNPIAVPGNVEDLGSLHDIGLPVSQMAATGYGDFYNSGTFGEAASGNADTMYIRTVADDDLLWTLDFSGCDTPTADDPDKPLFTSVDCVIEQEDTLNFDKTNAARVRTDASGALIGDGRVTAMPNTNDLVWMDGELWGVSGKAELPTGNPNNFDNTDISGIWRVDVEHPDTVTGQLTAESFPMPVATNWNRLAFYYASGTFEQKLEAGLPGYSDGVQPNGIVLGSNYGGQWTYGNGDLGISDNQTGFVFQLRVLQPTSEDPTFIMIAAISGPASSLNDAAIFPGRPADLAVVKTTSVSFAAGATIEYTITVTNQSTDGAQSSGFTLTDDLTPVLDRLWPADDYQSLTPDAAVALATTRVVVPQNCSLSTVDPISGGQGVFLVCNGRPLDAINPDNPTQTAEQFSMQFLLDVSTPSDLNAYLANADVTNYVSVLGNETDPSPDEHGPDGTGDPDGVPDNNQTEVTTTVAAIGVVKTASVSVLDAPGEVTYTYTVTNTGASPLSDVTVTDPDAVGLSGLTGGPCHFLDAVGNPTGDALVNGAFTLLPDQVAVCSATLTVDEATWTGADRIDTVAVAAGLKPGTGEGTVEARDDAPVALGHPAIEVTKSASPAALLTPGPVTYAFVVTNAGDVPLTGVSVTDTITEPAGLNAVDMSGCADLGDLGVGATARCEASYDIPAAAFAAPGAAVANTATARATTDDDAAVPVENTDDATVTLGAAPVPALTLTKLANASSVTAAGQLITYTFSAENTGDVTLDHIVINDPMISASGPACVITGALAPGAKGSCTAQYTVTATDIAAGTALANTATATGTPPPVDGVDQPPVTSPAATETVDLAAITLTKTADKAVVSAPGTLTYTLVVSNTGTTPLDHVSIADPKLGAGLDAVCADLGTLAPGASAECTGTYAVDDDAIWATQPIANTATATGTPPTEPGKAEPVKPTATARESVGVAAIAVDAEPDKPYVTTPGEPVTYTYTVTNTGGVTLTNVTVTDPLVPALPGCAVATLAPGDSVTCTGTHQATQDEIDNGVITGAATGTGTPTTPPGRPPADPVSAEAPTQVAVAAIALTKTANRGFVEAAGDA